MAKPKFGIILWVISTIVLVIGILALSNALSVAKKTLEDREEELAAVTKEKSDLEGELERTKAEKDELDAKVTAMDEEVRTLAGELETVKQTASREIEAKTREIAALNASIEKAKKEKEALAVELVRVKEDHQAAAGLLEEVRSAKEALEGKVKELMEKKEVELGRIIVTPDGQSLPAGSLEGEILVVNREYNFVVINLGQVDGVTAGTAFEILKDGRKVGDARVDKVYEKMSAATILQEDKKAIKKGMAVRSL